MTYVLTEERLGSGFKIPFLQAGEATTAYSLVYLNAAGRWMLADASAAATMPTVGLATEAVATGQRLTVLMIGVTGVNSWTWTPGAEIYASAVAGALTQTAPGAGAVNQVVAMAINATTIYFNPSGFDSGSGTYSGDVDIAGTLTVDTINEHLANAGVTIEGILIENGAFVVDSENITGEISYPVTTPIGDGHLLRARYTDYTPDRVVEWIYDLGNTAWHGVELL